MPSAGPASCARENLAVVPRSVQDMQDRDLVGIDAVEDKVITVQSSPDLKIFQADRKRVQKRAIAQRQAMRAQCTRETGSRLGIVPTNEAGYVAKVRARLGRQDNLHALTFT